jgi:hypothetical protein
MKYSLRQSSPTRMGEAGLVDQGFGLPRLDENQGLILMKIRAKVNRVRDSMKARPRINSN